MFRKPDTGAVAPAVAAPEVVMPQENRAEVDPDGRTGRSGKPGNGGVFAGHEVPAAFAGRSRGRRAVRLKRGAAWG